MTSAEAIRAADAVRGVEAAKRGQEELGPPRVPARSPAF
jgi:hypothetical protein